MEIIIEKDNKVLSEITFTSLQEKALILLEDSFLVNKINRILDFGVEQARLIYTTEKADAITEVELTTLADAIEAKKIVVEEPEPIKEA